MEIKIHIKGISKGFISSFTPIALTLWENILKFFLTCDLLKKNISFKIFKIE